MSEELFICLSVVAEHWGVGASVSEPALLIGWPLREKVDAGVPDHASSVVAAALAALYDVSFPTGFEPPPARASRILELQPANLLSRALGRDKRWLVTTRDPDLVQGAFDDQYFPWWHQAQVLMLSNVGTPIDGAAPLVRSLLQNPSRKAPGVLHAHGVEALVVPGIDGDVIGIRASQAVRRTCFDALGEAATRASVGCRAVTEPDFSALLAT